MEGSVSSKLAWDLRVIPSSSDYFRLNHSTSESILNKIFGLFVSVLIQTKIRLHKVEYCFPSLRKIQICSKMSETVPVADLTVMESGAKYITASTVDRIQMCRANFPLIKSVEY